VGVAAFAVGVVAFLGAPWILAFLFGPRGRRLVSRVRSRLFPYREPEPANRPVEQIAEDVRVRGVRFHALPEHASYAKRAAVSAAYDLSLAELCASLGQAHLLTVLPPGPELDAERRRVELVLMSFGLPPADAA
jgi:hypothetical protein